MDLRRGPRRLLPLALAVLLAACGGGGGGGDSGSTALPAVAGPPTTGATLVNSSSEALQSTQAVVAGADSAAARSNSLAGVSAFLGAPVAVHASPASTRKRALAIRATPCDEWVDAPCSGSATFDSNVPDTARVLKPGDYADIRFASVTGLSNGNSVVLNGRMRLDFQSTVNLDLFDIAGLTLLVTLDGFGGAVNGKSFGPVNDIGQLRFIGPGLATYTTEGVSYTGLNGVSASGPSDYRVAGTTVRRSYWAEASRYVDVALSNWRVAGARPVPGSSANVSGPLDTVSIIVESSSADTVVYRVTILNGNSPVTGQYVVTATYPGGGGAPTYAAVPGTL